MADTPSNLLPGITSSVPSNLFPLTGGFVSTLKMYRALLTQSGGGAPTAIVLANTLGGALVWSRTGAGIYLATLNGAFPDATKVSIRLQTPLTTLNKPFWEAFTSAPNIVQITTWNATYSTNANTVFDNLLNHHAIEILVAP